MPIDIMRTAYWGGIFGERWARHWLDVARFAESHGFEHDYDRKFAFHFRDFVIRALNADMPYENADMPYENADIPYGNADMPYGNADMPYGNADMPY